MSIPNQTGVLELGLDFVHQDFLGTVAGLADRQVSPVSMLQNTLMASLVLPPSGSIQYSPGIWWLMVLVTDNKVQRQRRRERSVTAVLVRVAAPDVLAGFGRVCSASIRTAQVCQMPPERLQRGVDSSVCTESGLLPVGSSLIFDHLWSCWWDSCSRVVCKFHRIWNITIPLVVVCSNKEAFSRCAWRTWGSWGSRGSGLSFWTLADRRWMLSDSFDP